MLSRVRGHCIHADARSVMALEFALVAPVMLTLTMGAVDGARALLIWAEIHNAANAIAQAAEKLAVTTNPSTGAVTAELTADQMQQAMSTIYAEIPGLDLGNGNGLFPGQFAVALGSVTYTPLCTSASGCGSQTVTLLWTTYLTVGGTKLAQGWYRACGSESQVAQLPANNGRMQEMVSPVSAGGTAMTLTPQIVADVKYVFTPYFPYFFGSVTFYATATMPAPIGGLSQQITLNAGASTGNVVSCS
jgi:Flp pilus assembly protein TadG